MGQWKRLSSEPIGAPMAEWVRTIPNNGLIRYLDIFNIESVLPTSAKALGEILTVKTDEFIKPPRLTRALIHVFGFGLVFTEGEVHKVSGILADDPTGSASPVRLLGCVKAQPELLYRRS
jgi:hypothetical protein